MSLPLFVAGCATAPPAAVVPPPAPQVGLESVINKGADVAIALLGPSSLDRREGPARHLQFAGTACVLDLFYYPPPGANAQIATYADARRPDGSAMQPGDCLRLLEAARASAQS